MMKKNLIGLLKILGVLAGLAIIGGIDTSAGLTAALIVLVYAVIAVFRGMPGLGRGLAWPIGILAIIAITGLAEQGGNERDARLAKLKVTDEAAYLTELKSFDDARWLDELKELRPSKYTQEISKRNKLEEQERREERAAACGTSNSTMAYIMQQDTVRSQLKAPSTADFPHVSKVLVRPRGDCEFLVRGYVDAQNSFGAMLRTEYETIIQRFPDSEQWQVQSVIFVN